MLSAFILFIIGGVIWLFAGSFVKARDVLKFFGMALMASSIISFFLYTINKQNTPNEFYYISFGILIIGMYVVWKNRNEGKNSLQIVANQQRYWNEVTPADVYNYYKHRKKLKKDRIEIDVNKNQKKLLMKNSSFSYLSPSFFTELNNLKLTKTDNYNDVKNSILYSAIFKKLKDIIEDKEITDEMDVFFNKILEDNGGYLEYFLLYLWENYTRDINIGTAYLEILAVNDIEEQLVGALNLCFLYSVTYKGSALYYAYKRYRGEINIKEEVQNNDDYEIKDDDF